MTSNPLDYREAEIQRAFRAAGIDTTGFDTKTYPDETNIIVYVLEGDFINAVELASTFTSDFLNVPGQPVFIVVRKAAATDATVLSPTTSGVQDNKVEDLIRLVSARSRVSSVEPSLVYVPDARASLPTITASRHHLVFGRRGAGKSALLMEARRQVLHEGNLSSWTNIQSLRAESPSRIFLYVLEDILSTVIAGRRSVSPKSTLSLGLSEVFAKVQQLISRDETSMEEAQRMVPRVQRALVHYLPAEDARVFCFIDDFYYIPRGDQPIVLDMLHGVTRDTNIWLKIASIRHLTNWWQTSPPVGLQSGQDADLIDLDVTLQSPEKASAFLEGILAEYAQRVGITSLSRIFNRPALDRLVLASGAVPRDYMVLATSALSKARTRPKARVAGVQDVNQAAGDAAGLKTQELEEDMAANSGVATQTLRTLGILREFCLAEKSFTYFLTSYRDKEVFPELYALLADLMDVRLIHLVSSGVSDPHQAGLRFEAFMLDLSQFSGSRLKQRITVLDFEDGHFVSKQTRSSAEPNRGKTSRQLTAILRQAPQFELQRLELRADSE